MPTDSLPNNYLLEPGLIGHSQDQGELLRSAARSLKRIADAQEHQAISLKRMADAFCPPLAED